ncbi:Pre-mRNA-processing protein 45 [Intoshia linei]|uniref:Pre-mRNA-processing protein 45 n=1 Tax=Intoshia linei TaxID=1819745 RepID=A0A177BAL7_9BILA|nr:Pre-mRNA-processing protein 45 [Intoshia linei]
MFTSSTLSTHLPSPVHEIQDNTEKKIEKTIATLECKAPAYGQRGGWKPTSVLDYGNGGSFPEIFMPQYPLGIGMSSEKQSNALPLQIRKDGKVAFHALAGVGHSKDKIIHATFNSLVPKVQDYNSGDLIRPTEEETKEKMQELKQKLQGIVESKVASALPVQHAERAGAAKYIRYTPSTKSGFHNSGATQRIVKIMEIQKDPMEPPRFRVSSKIPKAPPSPPAPVLHSPNRKITQKEQQNWKIPPCVSNWKNAKGYTIPLDKRLAADGRGTQAVHINENFAKLSEALYIAGRKAREAVALRAQIEKRVSEKEKERKEENLRELARKAREFRSGDARLKENKNEDVQERDQFRKDRRHERQRDRNIARAAPDKRSRLQKDAERDISEKIALGLAKPSDNKGAQMDQRLYSGTKGVTSGFADDDAYNVYNSAWKSEKSIASSIYKPSKKLNEEFYADEVDSIKKTSKFVPDKAFSGAKPDKNSHKRDGPVQFERDDDPFGLKILSEAKRSKKK